MPQRVAVGDPDLATGLLDPLTPVKFRQNSADDFARSSKFCRQFRVGGVDHVMGVGQLQQARGQPHVHALKDDVVDKRKKIRDPSGICCKHELPEHR